MLPAEAAGQVYLLTVADRDALQGTQAEGTEYRITVIATGRQRCGIALLGEAIGVQVDVGQIGEWLKRRGLQVNAIRRLGEHLSALRIVFGFLLARCAADLQIALRVDAMPAVCGAQGQAQRTDFMAEVRAQVVAVHRSPGMRAGAHVQRAVAIACDDAQTGVIGKVAIDTGQQPANRGGVTRGVVARVGLAPCAQGFEPDVVLCGSVAIGAKHTGAQALTHRIADLTAVVDQHAADGRVNFAGQLLEAVACRGSALGKQQVFIHRVTGTELFGGSRHSRLVRGLRHAIESGSLLDVQCDRVGCVVESATEEGVVGGHAAKLAIDAIGRLQHVVLATYHALDRSRTQGHRRCILQRQRHVRA